jgi:hypothetical protein
LGRGLTDAVVSKVDDILVGYATTQPMVGGFWEVAFAIGQDLYVLAE